MLKENMVLIVADESDLKNGMKGENFHRVFSYHKLGFRVGYQEGGLNHNYCAQGSTLEL